MGRPPTHFPLSVLIFAATFKEEKSSVLTPVNPLMTKDALLPTLLKSVSL